MSWPADKFPGTDRFEGPLVRFDLNEKVCREPEPDEFTDSGAEAVIAAFGVSSVDSLTAEEGKEQT